MTPEEKLMADLARLVHRYGPEPFERLASILRSPERAANLASVLEGALSVPKPSRKVAGYAPRPIPGAQILEEVGKSDPEKYDLLSSVRDQLASGEMFQSMRDLRHFAAENGISLGSANSRMKAIVPVLSFLASLPLDEAQKLAQRITYENQDDRSLARWSEVIMGSKSSSRSSNSADSIPRQ